MRKENKLDIFNLDLLHLHAIFFVRSIKRLINLSKYFFCSLCAKLAINVILNDSIRYLNTLNIYQAKNGSKRQRVKGVLL